MNMNQTATPAEENSGQFEPFDLTVYLGPDALPWISATSRVGAVHGIPRHTKLIPTLPDLLDLVYDYTDDIQFAEFQPKPELSGILGELIFGDDAVSQLFQATRGVAADRGRQVLFRILASPHLAVLPWELLPDPGASAIDRQPYLALAPDTHLVRQARGRTYSTRMNMLEAPLNLLLVLSSPITESDRDDWLSFDIFEVKRNLLSELAPLEQAGLLRIEVEDRPTIDNLRRRIGAQRRGYHLFHYVGHAFPEGLILEDRAGFREDLSGPKLVELLRLCPELRLAVFAGCETARSAADPAAVDTTTAVGGRDLLSLADYCVQEACPAVIGMQAVLPFSTERVFTRFFYQALASGYTTAESLRLARGAIQADRRVGGELLDWSVPALFVGSGEPGALVPRTTAAPENPPPPRAELNLGLSQSNARFFGRDLPLRQAVDVMIRRTPERVLVVSGASGIGKSALLDRALEEVGRQASHSLFVCVSHLLSDLEQGEKMSASEFSQKLSDLEADDVLERLCRFTNELLSYSGIETRKREVEWKANQWWGRVVEDMVRREFVLVIDDVGTLDDLQHGLLEKILTQLLNKYVISQRKEDPKAQRLRKELMAQLSELKKPSPKATRESLSAMWNRIGISENLLRDMGTMSDRLQRESAEVYSQCLEQQISALNTDDASACEPADETENLFMTLRKLEATRSSLGNALSILAKRRSPVRIVITAAAPPQDFFNVPDDLVFEMRVAPLTWAETWRWIRRNLPGLVRFGEDSLSRLWGRFGVKLELWEELERLVLKPPRQSVDLLEMAKRIAPSRRSRKSGGGTDQTGPRGQRALRIAVAGPFLAGPTEIAEAITQLAKEHGIGGRVVFDANEAGALATLLDEPSPFVEEGQALLSEILQWLSRVVARQPDIILLDYGAPSSIKAVAKQVDVQRNFIQNIQHNSLLIAAGGNKRGSGDSSTVTVPSAYPEVLSVGPLGDDGRLRAYAEWRPRLGKPNLFMTDNLAVTPLGMALKSEVLSRMTDEGNWGSSFSALHAVATAALVWSLLPNLSPSDIRDLLVEATKDVTGTKGARGLTMEDALALARGQLVERTLEDGPASLQTLSAITGLEGRVLSTILEQMTLGGRVVRLATGRLERFQLISQ